MNKEAVLCYNNYEEHGETVHCIRFSYTGISVDIYPRTDIVKLVKKANLQLLQFIDYEVKMDKDGSMERFFEEYGYKWNSEARRIEPK